MKKLHLILFTIIQVGLAGCSSTLRATVHEASSTDEAGAVALFASTSSPEEVGMSAEKLSQIDSIVKDGIQANAYPGCQVLILKKGKLVYDKCFGTYTYESGQKVTPNTLYDLASLSKTTGTLLAIMKLYDNGLLKLTDKASLYLPFLRGTDKENITITELLFHESGLPASLAISPRPAPSDRYEFFAR